MPKLWFFIRAVIVAGFTFGSFVLDPTRHQLLWFAPLLSCLYTTLLTFFCLKLNKHADLSAEPSWFSNPFKGGTHSTHAIHLGACAMIGAGLGGIARTVASSGQGISVPLLMLGFGAGQWLGLKLLFFFEKRKVV